MKAISAWLAVLNEGTLIVYHGVTNVIENGYRWLRIVLPGDRSAQAVTHAVADNESISLNFAVKIAAVLPLQAAFNQCRIALIGSRIDSDQ